MRCISPKNTVLLLYRSLIQPYLDYCNIIRSTYSTILRLLQHYLVNLFNHTQTTATLSEQLIQPYLDYWNIIWATYSTILRLLQHYLGNLFNHTQTTATLSGQQVIAITLKGCFENKKKALRAITCTKCNAHTIPLFKHLNISTVYDINILQTLCFVYKAVNNLLHKHLNTFFNLNIIFLSMTLDKAPACISHFIALNQSKLHQNTRSKTLEFIGLQYHQFTVFSHFKKIVVFILF